MNENNLEYLQNNLKYLGFGEQLNQTLKDAIEKEVPEFSMRLELDMPKPNAKDKPEMADKISYELQFSKSKDTDMYFFNKYTASLTASGKSAPLSQQFYINKGKGVTAKESYNLLSGRSVNKDVVLKSGEKANLWLKLDLDNPQADKFHEVKSFGEKYGFNLAETVDKFMILDMDKAGFRDQLLKSLEKGNLHAVGFSKDGREMNGFVTASPQFKTLDFFDSNLKPVYSKAVDLKNAVSVQNKTVEQPITQEAETAGETKKGRGR